MKKFFKNLLEKRGVKLQGWIPWGAGTIDSNPRTQSGNLSQLKRAMTLYRDLLMACPLTLKKGDEEFKSHPLLSLIEKPCPWYNRHEFFTRLTEDFFLSGNFYCKIQSNGRGEIESLLPFPPSSIFAYPRTDKGGEGHPAGDSSDPLSIFQNGYYYQAQYDTGQRDKNKKPIMRTHKFDPYDIWHLKNVWQQGSDQLNGLSLFQQYREVLGFSEAVLDLGFRFADAGGVGPVLISGIETQDSEQAQQSQQVIETFFKQKQMFLTLPPETEINEIGKGANSHMLMALSSISSLHLARIMGTPIELLSREDSLNSSGGGMNQKEVHRLWLRTSGKSYLKNVESKLNELIGEEDLKFEFNFRSLMASDLRESAMSIAQLISSDAVTKEEVREWLRL